jgi:UDP-N-acetylmuramoyl-tripeptide--D-alanyl-D-alanine ligase
MRLKACDIIAATRGRLATGSPQVMVEGINTDSRTVSEGQLFVALKGERFDAHDFLRQAVQGGAAAVMISRGDVADRLADFGGAVIIVADTLRALGDLAAWYRRQLRGRVIGITGSCGKTTVKEMLAQVLGRHLRGHHPVSSFNNAIGMPLTILRAEPDDDYLVLEIGTSAPGEIAHLTQIAQPDIGVVTCVGMTHLEGLGSIDGVAHEKENLIRFLATGGVAILNADDHRVAAMAEVARGQVVTFGLGEADIVAHEAESTAAGVRFLLNGRTAVHLPVPGRHNVYNALACAAVCRQFGIADEDVAAALADFRPASHRLVRHELAGGTVVIDDAYNANPTSVRAALDVLQYQPVLGRRVLALGDMRELGAESKALHRQIGQAIAESNIDVLVTVGSEMQHAALAAADRERLERHHFDTAAEAAPAVAALIQPGDTLLVKGSRSMAMEQVVAAVLERFGGPAPAKK